MKTQDLVRLLTLLVAILIVAPLSAQNVMRISNETTAPGAFATSRVLLTHESDVQGFQTSLIYPNAILTLEMITTDGMDVVILLLPHSIEFFITDVDPDLQTGIGWGASAAVFDFGFPFDNQVLPPGDEQSILAYHFSTLNDPNLLGTCVTLQLVSGLGSPPIFNVITVNGVSVIPILVPGDICFQPLPVFKRSDANSDGISNIADGIFIINYLFLSGAPPLCLDATDANNDEIVDVSDVVTIILYQFSGGPPPPTPFPDCGTETGGDASIGCANYPAC